MTDLVCLASPNDLIREGLSAILLAEGFTVVGSSDEAATVELDDLDQRVILIIDHYSESELAKSTEALLDLYANIDVVVITSDFDLDTTLSCFHAGAKGVIVRGASSKPMITALRLVALGERVFPSELLDSLDWNVPPQSRNHKASEAISDANLTQRELDVLCCLMAGYPNKLISRKLEVCEATVKVHVKAILRKLNVRNRTQAAMWASAHNLRVTEQSKELAT